MYFDPKKQQKKCLKNRLNKNLIKLQKKAFIMFRLGFVLNNYQSVSRMLSTA